MLLHLNVFFVPEASVVVHSLGESLEDVSWVHDALCDPGVQLIRGHAVGCRY